MEVIGDTEIRFIMFSRRRGHTTPRHTGSHEEHWVWLRDTPGGEPRPGPLLGFHEKGAAAQSVRCRVGLVESIQWALGSGGVSSCLGSGPEVP